MFRSTLMGSVLPISLNPADQARAPKTMAWRRPNEGLKYKCTAKGSHEGTGGKVAHFLQQ